MGRRHDAGCAAAGTVLAVERIASSTTDARGTAGGIRFTPEAVNVVNAQAEFRGEFRSPDDEWLRSAEDSLTSAAAREAAERGVTVDLEWHPTQLTQAMDSKLIQLCANAVDTIGFSRATLFSGAEHDAAIIARFVPTAMLFIPSVDGRSHCPEEFTEISDVVRGVHALAQSIVLADKITHRHPTSTPS